MPRCASVGRSLQTPLSSACEAGHQAGATRSHALPSSVRLSTVMAGQPGRSAVSDAARRAAGGGAHIDRSARPASVHMHTYMYALQGMVCTCTRAARNFGSVALCQCQCRFIPCPPVTTALRRTSLRSAAHCSMVASQHGTDRRHTGRPTSAASLQSMVQTVRSQASRAGGAYNTRATAILVWLCMFAVYCRAATSHCQGDPQNDCEPPVPVRSRVRIVAKLVGHARA